MKINMWHEARRQERKIRGMLVDYRKRAERRRDFYEKIKADPTQFLQIHGRRCKIHLDPNVAAAADSAVMMPWQGQADILIDRFDVRAHLDYIPPVKKEEETEVTQEERQLNYERYRIIAQNSFLGITEEKFLKQLHLEEQFGYTETKGKKEQKTGGAAIGFNYEDGTGISQPSQPEANVDSDEDSLDSDLDVDLAINVSKMEPAQAHDMNKHGRQFGMSSNDFYSFLTNDLEEAESYRLAKEEEQEKALFAGRKSRRERRYHREKRLANRVISPPSYMAQSSPTLPNLRESKSLSKSPSPENSGKITYITSFGDEEEPQTSSKPTYAEKVKQGKGRSSKNEGSNERIVFFSRHRSRSKSRDRYRRARRSRSRSRSKYDRNRVRRSGSRSRRSRSKSRSPFKSRRRSHSRSRSRRSGSRSRFRRSTRSRSRRRTRSRSASKRSRSRSRVKRSSSISRNRRSKSRERYQRSHSKSKPQITPLRSKRSRSSSSSSISKINASISKSPEKSVKNTSPTPVSSNIVPQQDNVIPEVKMESCEPTVLPRYYGRRKGDESSSELSGSENEEEKEDSSNLGNNLVSSDSKTGYGNKTGTAIKKSSAPLTIIERLKRKRQALLNRQFKADKIAEKLKTEREKQEQQTREDELREMAIKLRRRQREKRHAYDSDSSSSNSDSEDSEKSKTSSVGKKASSRVTTPPPPGTPQTSERDSRESKPYHRYDRESERRDADNVGGYNRDRRDRRDSSRERRWDRRSPSPRRQVYKERWRDDRESSRRDQSKGSKSLVDY